MQILRPHSVCAQPKSSIIICIRLWCYLLASAEDISDNFCLSWLVSCGWFDGLKQTQPDPTCLNLGEDWLLEQASQQLMICDDHNSA